AAADRPLRGPTAARITAEGSLEDTKRLADVPLRPLRTSRIGEVLRQRHIGYGIARGLEVEQQRDDGMSVRRDRELTLPALGKLAIARHDGVDELTDQAEQLPPLPVRECAALLGQAAHECIGAAYRLAQPGQVVPDGQIVDELIGGVAHALQGGERLRERGELEIRTEALDHLLALGPEARAQQIQ